MYTIYPIDARACLCYPVPATPAFSHQQDTIQKFIIPHFEMMKGRKSMHFTETLPSQNDTIAGHSLYRMFHVLVERLQQRGTGKHWGGWVGDP